MRIGELAAQAGVSTKAIRYYEDIGVLPPPRRAPNGYREYDPRARQQLGFIKDSQAAGLTLDEIRHVLDLKGKGVSTCEHVRAMLDRRLHEVEQRIAMLEATKAELERLSSRARKLDPADCTDPVRCQTIDTSVD
ncbi:MAG: heavy metal-responsive transcriptional regulator [Acidimicrobiia bacterium]